MDRSWDVLLIGGPSGVGKTSVSYAIARRFDVGITEIDDLFITAETLTTPEQQPALHYWRLHPEAPQLPAEDILQRQIDVARSMAPAVANVIENHLETATPIVLEGDFLLPELAAAQPPTVKAVFLIEDDEAQIVANYSRREPDEKTQAKRAQVSRIFGDWLKDEARRYDVPTVSARPWDSGIERLLDAL